MGGALPALPPLEHPAPGPRLLIPAASVLRIWARGALDLLFPALCAVCRRRLEAGRRDPLCGPCWVAIDRLAPPWCDRCGWSFSEGASTAPSEASPGVGGAGEAGARTEPPELCGRCLVDPPAWDWARAAGLYAGVLREAVHALKFQGRRRLARPLGDLLLEQCGADVPADVEALVPVPLAPDRQRERGFNQALLLADRLAPGLGVPVRVGWLRRTRATLPQSDLGAAERAANVRGAFVASPGVEGRHVVVVDDVVTTGATVGDCARALGAAGARTVGVLAVARVG